MESSGQEIISTTMGNADNEPQETKPINMVTLLVNWGYINVDMIQVKSPQMTEEEILENLEYMIQFLKNDFENIARLRHHNKSVAGKRKHKSWQDLIEQCINELIRDYFVTIELENVLTRNNSKVDTQVSSTTKNKLRKGHSMGSSLNIDNKRRAQNLIDRFKIYREMVKEYKKSLPRNTLQISNEIKENAITVCVRKRPLNAREISEKEVDIISVPSSDMMIIHEPKVKVDMTRYLENTTFKFDYTFDENCTNELVYHFTAKPLVKVLFEGGMATCFAYGQTGTGKTHTMGGAFKGKNQIFQNGIYSLAAADVFTFLEQPEHKSKDLKLTVSFLEIYGSKVFDLLMKQPSLRILEDDQKTVQIIGLTEKTPNNMDELLHYIKIGSSFRTIGKTSANNNSSRSHTVFQIILRNATSKSVYGKFSFIDLAGNERGADTIAANRLTKREGAEINTSLLALKECIRSLENKQAHIPFRRSALTLLLKDSFMNKNSKTCMIAMVSPGINSSDHTLNTLRYANRVKELDPSSEEMIKPSKYVDDIGPSGINSDAISSSNLNVVLTAVQDSQRKLMMYLENVNNIIRIIINESSHENFDRSDLSLAWTKLIKLIFWAMIQAAVLNRHYIELMYGKKR